MVSFTFDLLILHYPGLHLCSRCVAIVTIKMTAVTQTTVELQETSLPASASDRKVPVADDINEASRVVDAGVPEGGFGWYALAACGK